MKYVISGLVILTIGIGIIRFRSIANAARDSRNRSALRFLERRNQALAMNRQTKPSDRIPVLVYLGVTVTLLLLGALLVYSGVHQGIIHQEIVSRPPPGKGGGMAAYGARAVWIGIGLAALGSMFIYGAVLLIRGWSKLTR